MYWIVIIKFDIQAIRWMSFCVIDLKDKIQNIQMIDATIE